jgi:hypothetical protein
MVAPVSRTSISSHVNERTLVSVINMDEALTNSFCGGAAVLVLVAVAVAVDEDDIGVEAMESSKR